MTAPSHSICVIFPGTTNSRIPRFRPHRFYAGVGKSLPFNYLERFTKHHKSLIVMCRDDKETDKVACKRTVHSNPKTVPAKEVEIKQEYSPIELHIEQIV